MTEDAVPNRSGRAPLASSAVDIAEQLRLALLAGGLGSWRWDRATGSVRWDERCEELFGFEPGTFDGRFETWLDMVHPLDRDAVTRRVDFAIASSGPYRIEHRIVTPSGEVRWISGSAQMLVGPDGSVTGAIGCVADITDRVASEATRDNDTLQALESAEAHRAENTRLDLIAAVNDALARATTRRQAMKEVCDTLVSRLADWCAVYTLGPTHDPLPTEFEVAHRDAVMVSYAREQLERLPPVPSAAYGVGRVLSTGEAEFTPVIDDRLLDEVGATDAERETVERLRLTSVIVVPLVKRGRVIGALQLARTDAARSFTHDDLALAEIVGPRIASSFENLRLTAEQHAIATTLQQALLPSSLPEIPGLDVAVRYLAAGDAADVGGDFYDLFTTDERAWGLLIGDVAGKGPEAAAQTALARHSVRMSAWHGDRAGQVLRWLNRAFVPDTDANFCSAVFAVMRPASEGFCLSLAVAGHPLPRVHRADGRLETVGVHGPILGIFADPEITETEVALGPGDTLFLFTDGLTDLPPPDDLDDDELHRMLAASALADDAHGTADSLLARLEARTPRQHRQDDIALLILRVPRAHRQPV